MTQYTVAALFPTFVSDDECRFHTVDQMLSRFPDAMIVENGGPHITLVDGYKQVVVAFSTETEPLTQGDVETYTSILSVAIDRIRKMLKQEKENDDD